MGELKRGRRRYRPPDGVRLLFFGVLAMWLLFPVLIRDNLAQDAIPYVVAGELVTSQPDAIYAEDASDLYDLDPAFASRSCELSPPETDCASLNVPFVSLPQALPFAWVISRLGGTGGVLLMRVLAALALVGGMALLWERLSTRSPRAGQALLVTALLLTPFALVPLPLGQTSPYLFLSACLGVVVSDGRRRWLLVAIGALWALTISLKLFPLALVAVLVWQRRWRLLAVSAVVLAAFTAVAVALGAPSISEFVVASGAMAQQSLVNPYNGSFDAVVELVRPGGATSLETAISLAVRAVVVGALAWWRVRRADHDTQWAWAWLAVLLFVPLVWAHYLWLAVAAIGIALAGRRTLDDRTVAILPLVALALLPISLPNASGSAVPVLQFAFLVAAVGVATWLAEPAVEATVTAEPPGDPVEPPVS